jgi:hypothetical protein
MDESLEEYGQFVELMLSNWTADELAYAETEQRRDIEVDAVNDLWRKILGENS